MGRSAFAGPGLMGRKPMGGMCLKPRANRLVLSELEGRMTRLSASMHWNWWMRAQAAARGGAPKRVRCQSSAGVSQMVRRGIHWSMNSTLPSSPR